MLFVYVYFCVYIIGISKDILKGKLFNFYIFIHFINLFNINLYIT